MSKAKLKKKASRLQKKEKSKLQLKEKKEENKHLLEHVYYLGRQTCVSQAILNIIKTACQEHISNEAFESNLQQIKTHFFNREYDAIFSEPKYLPIYTTAYAPSRALAYNELFTSHPELMNILATPNAYIYCMGSGAGSEIVGLTCANLASSTNENQGLEIHCQDYADYSKVQESLEKTLKNQWNIQDSRIKYSSSVADVLKNDNTNGMTVDEHISKATLVTAMFLMNELFTMSKKETVQLITRLVKNLTKGSYFLLVDSAGSFSNLNVNNSEGDTKKTIMIYQLIDMIKSFDILIKDDAVWYRLPNEKVQPLHYPTKLNNMRYFLRLYQKI
ncbi:hypothetical protein BCR32DRAFT_212309 [Anaeromyces robustus]|uniref:Uncharacterized protein n=1 Tax=Anaeromyces robustus TaxID=1754192 RepID=A0A1Y1VUG8_9FUNG|nr:hypothetical protein BCR32DRAFT_212309 [Anaeromyces robustus]|eukprot:ORX64940.1 hypothetical protein BCR32DRAFT_212309 [Anaeromyces robustus]